MYFCKIISRQQGIFIFQARKTNHLPFWLLLNEFEWWEDIYFLFKKSYSKICKAYSPQKHRDFRFFLKSTHHFGKNFKSLSDEYVLGHYALFSVDYSEFEVTLPSLPNQKLKWCRIIINHACHVATTRTFKKSSIQKLQEKFLCDFFLPIYP